MPLALRLFVVLASALTLLGASCDDAPVACTAIGCSDALYVDVASADGAPQPGRYAVTVAPSDADPAATCAFTLRPDQTVADPSADCRGVFVADDGRVRVQRDRVDGLVTVGVTRDGIDLGRFSVRPAYLGQFPNGPDCGEVCQQATVRVQVP